MWKLGETIGDKEGRLDVCVACAGILKQDIDCLEYPADVFQQVRNGCTAATSDNMIIDTALVRS